MVAHGLFFFKPDRSEEPRPCASAWGATKGFVALGFEENQNTILLVNCIIVDFMEVSSDILSKSQILDKVRSLNPQMFGHTQDACAAGYSTAAHFESGFLSRNLVQDMQSYFQYYGHSKDVFRILEFEETQFF